MMHYGFNYVGMLLFCLFGLIVLAALIAAALLLFRAYGRAGGGRAISPAGGEDGALAILRERYARGEVTKEQYEQMRADLLHP